MKSAEQWTKEWTPGEITADQLMKRIREIQVDALRHAAEVARLTRTCGGGNLTIASRITMEIDRLQTR